ncbi:MAG: efflux RND transporter periplasmic adaptor subunit [Alphaproteobacteria bacterium]|nr:efflux RND transporter periplasmic adaptor subunit [Alphaproteobacteria bacterium]
MKKFILLLVGLIAAWSAIWVLCSKQSKHAVIPFMPNELAVSVKKIEPEQVVVTHEYIGHVIAIQAVSVLPYISGFIDQVLVSGGAKVRRGQTLFILKQDQYLAAIDVAKAQLSQANADLEKARLYFERIEQTPNGAISKTELDNARSNFLAAEAVVTSAKAQLKSAEVNYDYTIIQAPIDGIVGNITATPGEYVSPQLNPLAYILQYNPIRVVFSMPDKDFLNLGTDVNFFKTGLLKLKLPNGQVWTGKGSVKFADNKVAANTSSIDLFADFENAEHKLLPGGYVKVLYEEQIADAIVVNRQWITTHPNGDFVYVLKDNMITKVPVRLGASIQKRVLVVSGLKQGDLLIVDPITTNMVGQRATIAVPEGNSS